MGLAGIEKATPPADLPKSPHRAFQLGIILGRQGILEFFHFRLADLAGAVSIMLCDTEAINHHIDAGQCLIYSITTPLRRLVASRVAVRMDPLQKALTVSFCGLAAPPESAYDPRYDGRHDDHKILAPIFKVISSSPSN